LRLVPRQRGHRPGCLGGGSPLCRATDLGRGAARGGRGPRRDGRCAAARSRWPRESEPVALDRVGRGRRARAAPPRGDRAGPRACRMADDRRAVRGRPCMARRRSAEAARACLRDADLRAGGSSSRRGVGASRGRDSIRRRARAGRPARVDSRRAAGWRRAAAVARGLAIAAPLIVVFGALFMSADAVFAQLVSNLIHFDFPRIAGHVLLFSIAAWLSTGYLRGFLTGTELPLPDRREALEGRGLLLPKRPTLGITEVATALAAINLLFLVFVIVQFRYLFGGDALVQVTADLTYADYARRGFFELVFAIVLVVPLLLAADWLLDQRIRRDALVFR